MNMPPGKRMLAIAAAVAAAIAIAIVLAVPAQGEGGGRAIVATVNGEPIEFSEFTAVMLGQRARITGYFQGAYGAEDGPDFWTASYNGEVPLEKLKREALTEAVRNKTLQLLGKRNGLLEDAGYDAFLKELRRENESRKRKLRDGQPVYGPQQYGESAYYAMRLADLRHRLEDKLSGQLTASDREIESYYEDNRKAFASGDSVLPLAQAKDRIAVRLRDVLFERLIDDEIARSDVAVNDDVLNAIDERALR